MDYPELGGSRSGFHTCGVASSMLIRHNGHRKKLIIGNNAANTCYFVKGEGPAVVGSGFFLLAGGTAIMEPDIRGYIWKGEVHCISLVGAQNLTWQEDW